METDAEPATRTRKRTQPFGEDTERKIAGVEQDIKKVEVQIEGVAKQIEQVEEDIQKIKTKDSLSSQEEAELAALRKEKEQLRTKEEQLRTEKQLYLSRQTRQPHLTGTPETAAYQRFAETLRRSEVRSERLKLCSDGSLQPPPRSVRASDQTSPVIEIFHIDLTEYRARLDEDDEELHVGAFNVMHIVRLPLCVPAQDVLGSDTLWVTGDDLAVFSAIRRHRKAVLLGNPGIGKSWWQWQYLLYSLCPDVYVKLLKNTEFPFNHENCREFPSVIIRYDAYWKETIVFKLNDVSNTSQSGSTVAVEMTNDASHLYSICKRLDQQHTVLLFEPGAATYSTVPYKGLINMSVVATVAPDERHYKEFVKNHGLRVYLPCPSKPEIIAIAAFMRSHVTPLLPLHGFETASVEKRIDTLGPFPRYVLADSRTKAGLADVGITRDQAVKGLHGQALQHLAQLSPIEISSDTSRALVSHWFLCFEVNRSHVRPYFAASTYLVVSSKSTMEIVRSKYNLVEFDVKVRALQKLHRLGTVGNFALEREWLEDLFAYHATSGAGLKWRVHFPSNTVARDSNETIQIKISNTRMQSVAVGAMTDDTLYYRMESWFPFVDGVWTQHGRLYAFQATTSRTHPKSVDTFRCALQRLEIDERELSSYQLTIYYVMMPRCFDHWHGKKVPQSFFWKDVKAEALKIKEYSSNITFALICPPENFGNGMTSAW